MRTIAKNHNDGLFYIEVLPAGTKTLSDKVNQFIGSLVAKLERFCSSINL